MTTAPTSAIGVAIPAALGDLAPYPADTDRDRLYLRKHDAHYMFVAKDNQKTLLNDIRLWFHDDAKRPPDFAHTTGKPINGKLHWEQRVLATALNVSGWPRRVTDFGRGAN